MLSDCRKKVTVEGSASQPEVFGKFSGNSWTLINAVQNCNGSFVHSPEEYILSFHDRLKGAYMPLSPIPSPQKC